MLDINLDWIYLLLQIWNIIRINEIFLKKNKKIRITTTPCYVLEISLIKATFFFSLFLSIIWWTFVKSLKQKQYRPKLPPYINPFLFYLQNSFAYLRKSKL
jgi:hypothetical protein